MLSLATRDVVAHVRFMPKTTPADAAERKLLGRALALLRDREGLTQAEAAERFAKVIGKDDFTPQAWGQYEAGKPKRMFYPEVQAQLAEVVGSTVEELLDERDRLREIAEISPVQERVGVREPVRLFESSSKASARQQAIFPLPEGDIVLSYPAVLSEQSKRDLADYLKIFVRRLSGAEI